MSLFTPSRAKGPGPRALASSVHGNRRLQTSRPALYHTNVAPGGVALVNVTIHSYLSFGHLDTYRLVVNPRKARRIDRSKTHCHAHIHPNNGRTFAHAPGDVCDCAFPGRRPAFLCARGNSPASIPDYDRPAGNAQYGGAACR